MADSDFKTQVSRDENANSASNVMFFQLADNAGNTVSITGGALDVNATVTPEDVYVDDSAFVVGTDNVGASGYLADETAPDSVDEGDIGIARMTLDRKQLFVLADPTTDANRLAIDANGTVGSRLTDGTTEVDILNATIDALQVAISDGTDQLAINPDGSINAVITTSAGTAVHDYDTATVAGAGTSNHDYTVTAASTLSLKQIIFAASGKLKIELQTGPVAGLVSQAVAFLDADSYGELTFAVPYSVPDTSTGTVRIIRTNRSGSQDVYTTIIGEES